MQNAKEVVEFLYDRLSNRPQSSYFGSMKCFCRIFWDVKTENVDGVSMLFICDPMKGTMKIHSICAFIDKTLLQLFVKDLTCFSEFCLDSCWTKCQNV